MTVHSPWKLKKSLYPVPQKTWRACGAYLRPGSCAVPTVLLVALASSLTYPDHIIFGCLVETLTQLWMGVGRCGFSSLHLWANPPHCSWQDENPSTLFHYNKHLTFCISGITNLTVYTRTAGVLSRDSSKNFNRDTKSYSSERTNDLSSFSCLTLITFI